MVDLPDRYLTMLLIISLSLQRMEQNWSVQLYMQW